jgi:hypothetical protein
MLSDAARERPVYKRSLRAGQWVDSARRLWTEEAARAELDRIFKLLKGRRHDPRRADPLTILRRSEVIYRAVEEKRKGGARKEEFAVQDVADESKGKLTPRQVRSAMQYVRAHQRAIAKISDRKMPGKSRRK